MPMHAAFRIVSGTCVSHTPWARLMPPTFSHSMDMARISACSMLAPLLLRESVIVSWPPLWLPPKLALVGGRRSLGWTYRQSLHVQLLFLRSLARISLLGIFFLFL